MEPSETPQTTIQPSDKTNDAAAFMRAPSLEEYRCNCGKLLFKGHELRGEVEIKCRRCTKIQLIAFREQTSI